MQHYDSTFVKNKNQTKGKGLERYTKLLVVITSWMWDLKTWSRKETFREDFYFFIYKHLMLW